MISRIWNYLKFKTFKTQSNTGEYTETFCYLPPNATNAYITAEKLINQAVDQKRSERSELRSIILAAGKEDTLNKLEILPCGQPALSDLREIVQNMSDEEIQLAQKNRKKYIYVDWKWGRQKRGSNVFRNDLVSFYIRHNIHTAVISMKTNVKIQVNKQYIVLKFNKRHMTRHH